MYIGKENYDDEPRTLEGKFKLFFEIVFGLGV